VSEPTITYLGPAGGEDSVVSVQPEVITYICHRGEMVNYKDLAPADVGQVVAFEVFDRHVTRLTAERDALQLRLNAADQRIDELTTKPSDVERQRLMEIVEQYPNGDPLEYDAAVRKLQQ